MIIPTTETRCSWIAQMSDYYWEILNHYVVPPSSDDANTLARWAQDIAKGTKQFDLGLFHKDIVGGHDDIRETK